MSDFRRTTPRSDAFRFGTVQAGSEGAVEVMIWDISAEGAMIELSGPGIVPDRLDLNVPGESRPRTATVVWRTGRRLGLAF